MGKVFLVGAGPGNPELLTVRAARILACADVVLHDSLVSPEALQLANPTARLVDVGKRHGRKLLTQDEINSLLVAYAARHDTVVRLKGGDPVIFGRAGEEMDALRQARVDFEVVPGVTSALAAAACAQIPLTDRRVASQVLFTTFSRGDSALAMDWTGVNSSTTLAVYMPGADYAEISRWLQVGGLPPDLACAIVSRATSPFQRIAWTTIAALAHTECLPAPALLLIGRVVALRARESAVGFWASVSLSPDRRVSNLC